MLTKFKLKNSSDTMCPRCWNANKPETWNPSVDRFNRKCRRCNGVLLWAPDDTKYFDERRDDYFIWYRPPFKTDYAWYHKSYFKNPQ